MIDPLMPPPRRRLLYVTDAFPYPLTSGYLRHYHFIRLLASTHAITLLSLVGGDYAAAHAEGLRSFVEHIEVFPSAQRSRSVRRKAASRLRAWFSPQGGDAAALRLAARARALHHEHPFDLVLLAGKRAAPVLDALAGVPVVADLCDAASLRLRDQARRAPGLRRGVLWAESLHVARLERRILTRARSTLFASRRDLEALTRSPVGDRAAVVPNGVDAGHWQRTSAALDPRTIVFTGVMSYSPNEDAALRLAHLLAAVRRIVPDAELLLVGKSPTPRVWACATIPGVTVTGEVPDVRPFLERAAVFAAPLRFGAGIQNKVLEALAMQVPAIVSLRVAAGLRSEVHGPAPVCTAETDAEWVTALAGALRAARTGAVPDARGREFVTRAFGWDEVGVRLRELCAGV